MSGGVIGDVFSVGSFRWVLGVIGLSFKRVLGVSGLVLSRLNSIVCTKVLGVMGEHGGVWGPFKCRVVLGSSSVSLFTSAGGVAASAHICPSAASSSSSSVSLHTSASGAAASAHLCPSSSTVVGGLLAGGLKAAGPPGGVPGSGGVVKR